MSTDWPRLSAHKLSDYRIFSLHREQYRSPRTGQPVEAVVLQTADWVNVVALTPASELVCVRQFRFGSQRVTLEIPGGIVDPGETPLEAARRELREETGYEATRWTDLGSVAPNPAFLRNRLHCFLAEGCRLEHAPQPDPGEDLAVELCPTGALDRLVDEGQIDHSLVLAALLRWRLRGEGQARG